MADDTAQLRCARIHMDITMNRHHLYRSLCVCTAILVSGTCTIQAVQAQALPDAHSAGAVQYRCGGIGLDESTAMRSAMKDYPLALLFAAASGEYQADVKVELSGAQAAAFTASGPVCLLQLPSGRYTVKATTKDGREKSQTVEIGRSHESLDFRF